MRSPPPPAAPRTPPPRPSAPPQTHHQATATAFSLFCAQLLVITPHNIDWPTLRRYISCSLLLYAPRPHLRIGWTCTKTEAPSGPQGGTKRSCTSHSPRPSMGECRRDPAHATQGVAHRAPRVLVNEQVQRSSSMGTPPLSPDGGASGSLSWSSSRDMSSMVGCIGEKAGDGEGISFVGPTHMV